jgi:hypothetical protein
MSENTTLDNNFSNKEFEEDIGRVINNYGTKKFSDPENWWSKLGLKVNVTEKEMINEIVTTLSKYLTKGLLQLTIEEIINEKKSKDAIKEKRDQTIVMSLNKKLSSFKVYVEFIVRSGSIEIKKFKYDFKVEPKVQIKDIKVNIQENEIKSISFGLFVTSMTLSLLIGESVINIGSIEKDLSLPVITL